MKMINKICAFLITISLIIPMVFTTPVRAESSSEIFYQPSLEDDFTDNEILIVTMPFANYYEYSTTSFSEIDCIDVKELSRCIAPDKLCRIIKLTIEGHSKQNVLDSIDVLNQRNDLYIAEPNYIISMPEVTDTIATASITSLEALGNQQATFDIDLREAWQYEPNDYAEITIGIIDTGIDASNPYLNGYIDTVKSESFASSTIDPLDDNRNHGTGVAGVIRLCLGAYNDGIEDRSEYVDLVSLRVESTVTADGAVVLVTDYVIEAIEYANEEQFDIINMSFASGATSLLTSIRNFEGLMVCSAGNESLNIDTHPRYPASYNGMSNLISVGASQYSFDDEEEIICSFSNFGISSVDLFAPGGDVLSTDTENSFHIHAQNGTSFAAPFVTGVAALMLTVNPQLTPAEIKHIIMSVGHDDITNLSDLCVSGGRLNAKKAVQEALTDAHTERATQSCCVSCSSCGYVVYHDYRYTILINNDAQHKAKCAKCSYEFNEGHDWESLISGGYRCRKCLKTSNDSFVPGIMGLPPENDEEKE